jgi:hypothetical protein
MVSIGDMTLRSHVLIVTNGNLRELVNWAMVQGFTEFSVCAVDDGFQLAHPLTEEERQEYLWLYHKMKRKGDDPDKPKGPPSGPKGGGPSGSPAGGHVFTPEEVTAIAA